MDIREALLAEHSKQQTMKIVRYVDGDPERFDELMRQFLGPVYRLSQRAAWAVNYCGQHHPELVRPYFSRLVQQLERSDTHDAVRRNVARMLQFVDVPKRLEGRVFAACYNLLDDPGQPVAVRAFSLGTAVKIARGEEPLLDELRLVATKYPSLMTPGFRARTRRLLGVG